MSNADLDRYINQLIDAHSSPAATVAWQGGEPTLMGLDFYRRAIEIQNRYAKPGMRFENTLQTYGTLLTDEWCEFLKENDYLIGISIDGPQPLHDVNRVNKRGEGTFDKVIRGLRLLQKHEVEYNVLTTVNSVNGSFRSRCTASCATMWEPIGCSSSQWSSVFNETCGLDVALEHNGDLYSGDHFVEPEYLIGNIADTPMGDLVGSQRQYDFGMDKRDDLPQYWLDCDVRFACHGNARRTGSSRHPTVNLA